MSNGNPAGASPNAALIVGGGLAGLAVAAMLQARGVGATVLEADSQPGGRARPFARDGYRFDAAWSVDRKDAPIALACADAKIGAPVTTPLALRVVGDRAGALGTGSLGFIARTRAASLNGRIAARSALAASGRNHDRFDHFLETQGLRGASGLLMRALAGPAGADPRVQPSAAFALARETVLERRGVVGHAGGYDRLIRELAAAARVETGRRVERLLLDDGHARGVRLEGGEELAAAHVVLALAAPAARSLFDDAAWAKLPSDERIRFEAAATRAALVVGWKLKEPLREPMLALVGDPPAHVTAASAVDPTTAPAGRGCLVGVIGLAGDALAREPARLEELAAALERAVAPLVPGFPASVEGRELSLREVDDAAYTLAGGRDRPPATFGGFDNLHLAGEATDAPHSGAERALASARAVARRIG